ncbi:FecR family protein [Chitinophaga costaii]|uniref:FecR family protein n=1 Tax=Chitinophaga costaii TaxID=1335309 RepID=A0A1C4AUN8_9BACT|nr:FecR family protein [Chitinophaga costaii]PUZ26751.1 FecR family protein [Chitinophaga costaii]SCB98309.1 FecR family protein [Chitinophaga costaii]
MENETEHIRQLCRLYASNQATDAQVKELFRFLEDPENDAASRELVLRTMDTTLVPGEEAAVLEDKEQMWQNMLQASDSLREQWGKRKRRRVMMLPWLAAAAVITGIIVFMYVDRRPAPRIVATLDVPAGGNKAILTLSDGSTITLDSAGNGTIARQGPVAIVKSANGAVYYDTKDAGAADRVMMNKIATPVGGQYQVSLPDGSKVWLNAASSVTYPAAFTDRERKISVTGEVYIAVANDAAHPFAVAIPGHSGIEVLGTSFNINAYGDEGNTKTTLIEGRIKMTGSNVILKPGEQAVESDNEPLSIHPRVNVEKEIAWKNGIFYFEDASLPQVMKQLERWYNIKVLYKGTIPALMINGKMDRNISLQGVMDFLTKMGVNYTLKDRTLLVTGN